jgi:hypothetical protein
MSSYSTQIFSTADRYRVSFPFKPSPYNSEGSEDSYILQELPTPRVCRKTLLETLRYLFGDDFKVQVCSSYNLLTDFSNIAQLSANRWTIRAPRHLSQVSHDNSLSSRLDIDTEIGRINVILQSVRQVETDMYAASTKFSIPVRCPVLISVVGWQYFKEGTENSGHP